jgi:predicted O-linked N-acetylglucosamine transferase (SPINDLY family)
MTTAVARNAPCPCGSGRRYKDCHGTLALASAAGATATAPAEAAIDGLRTNARAALAQSDREAALAHWRALLAADAEDPEAHFHLGNAAREDGRIDAAIAHYEQALRRAPTSAPVRNNLGLALEAAGRRDAAVDTYRAVLSVHPDDADALGNLANISFDDQRYADAASGYARLFALRRDVPVPVLVRRAIALQKTGHLEDAEACFADAVARWPDDAQLLSNLGSVRVEQSRFDEADPVLTRALEIDPGNRYALSMLVHARTHRCAWDGLDALIASIERALAEGGTQAAEGWNFAPLPLLALPLSAQALRRAAFEWGSAFAPAPGSQPPLQPLPATQGRRLRIGFVSSDFRRHPVGSLIPELLERMDRERFEVFAYGLLPSYPGPEGARIASAVDRLRDLSSQDAEHTVATIRADRIDIALDLNGYTNNARPEIFARRCAPVQVNAIGFSSTMGTRWYEAMLADAYSVRGAPADAFSERLACMPHAYYPSDTTRNPALPALRRDEYGLPADALVLCSQAGAYKILPAVFDAWLRLLDALPEALLWLRPMPESARANLEAHARKRSVDAGRMRFAPLEVPARYVARFALADLYLDTHPFGSHTTVNDALYAGLPVITWAGDTMPSRVSASQLHAIGLDDCVTDSLPAYEALALALGRDRRRLAALRNRLRENRATQPLFDMARYAHDFGELLRSLSRSIA